MLYVPMKPTLTVWMPNFNHAQYIGHAIEAIVNQSHPPNQFTIIDDASTDSSREVITSYQKKYPWITAIDNDRNVGVLAIMARGVKEITTDYVLMSSADDYILPGFFAAAMQAAEHNPKAGIIFGQMRVEDDAGTYLYTGRAKRISTAGFLAPVVYRDEYLKKEAVTQSLSAASIYRVAALREVGGFRAELGAWSDTFALQTMALSFGAYYLAQPVSVWVVHTKGVSQGMKKNPRVMLGIINQATLLMRLPEFSSLFSRSYIYIWATKYRVVVWVQYLISVSPIFLQRGYARVIRKLQ